MEKPCKVAIVGAGNMAREHARAFKAVPGVSLVGIQSRTRARAESLAEEFGIAGVFDSLTDLYTATHADLVVVTVTEPFMAEVACACAQFPWTILLEKPPGIDAAAAHLIESAANRQESKVFVALNRRFLSSTQTALNDLEGRKSGVRYIHVQDRQNIDEARAAGHPKDVLDAWMYANSIHLVDYLTVFGRGEIRSVENTTRWRPEGVPVLLAKIELTSGDVGLYEGIWQGPGPWAVTVTHPERRWEMRPLEKAVFQNAGERQLNATECHAWDGEFKPGFRLQAEQAVAAARGEPSTLPTLRQGVATMDLIKAIFQP